MSGARFALWSPLARNGGLSTRQLAKDPLHVRALAQSLIQLEGGVELGSRLLLLTRSQQASRQMEAIFAILRLIAHRFLKYRDGGVIKLPLVVDPAQSVG